MFNTLFLLIGLTAFAGDIDSKQEDPFQGIHDGLEAAEMEYKHIVERVHDAYWAAADSKEADIKCVDSSIASIQALDGVIDFNTAAIKRAIEIDQLDLAYFHFEQVIDAVDEAGFYAQDAEVCAGMVFEPEPTEDKGELPKQDSITSPVLGRRVLKSI